MTAVAGETPGYVGRRRGRSGLLMSFVDAGAVVAGAARLWWRHWPVLFGIYLLGQAASAWLVHLAVITARWNGTAGYLVYLLSPVVFMISLALMLLAVRRSLPRLATTGRATARDLVGHLTSVLVPFLAIYTSLGMARDESTNYYYKVFEDEVLANPASITDPGSVDIMRHLPFTVRSTLVAAVLIVFVLRWLLPKWQLFRGWILFSLVMGYLELLWLSQLSQEWGPDNAWLHERVAAKWLADAWAGAANGLGPLRDVVLWVGDQLGKADVVLIAPLAWLLLGAVVYRREVNVSLEVDDNKPPPLWLDELPRPMRWLGTGIHLDLRNRFGPLVNGVRIMGRIGLVTTLFFCLLFTAAMALSQVAWEVERLIIGPNDVGTRWMPLSYPLSTINSAISTVAVICLIAAAIDRILLIGNRGIVAEPGAPADPGPVAAASAPVPAPTQSGAVSHR
ncbi:hypothetical protein [Luedemannella flava]|uniref:hypothetical protein n=1 Tax=Luedemannella flava TaxID=349316 RepID=UPI0031E09DC4